MNAVDAVSPTAAAKEITITTSLAPALGSMVADATRLQQVIWNLLANAVKFTPRHGNVTVSARRTSSQIEIAVSDTGEGIDPQFLPHIFEPFRQAESPQTRIHGGLGLGLSIVRYIAEAHGGTVAAASEGRGKGTTFTVSLPVLAVTTTTGAVRNSLGDTFMHRDRLRGVDIVLVDDEPESRRCSPPSSAPPERTSCRSTLPVPHWLPSISAARTWSSPTSPCPRWTATLSRAPCAPANTEPS